MTNEEKKEYILRSWKTASGSKITKMLKKYFESIDYKKNAGEKSFQNTLTWLPVHTSGTIIYMNTSDIARELGQKGGKKTLEKYGTEHFRKIIRKRWDKKKEVQKTNDDKTLDK